MRLEQRYDPMGRLLEQRVGRGGIFRTRVRATVSSERLTMSSNVVTDTMQTIGSFDCRSSLGDDGLAYDPQNVVGALREMG